MDVNFENLPPALMKQLEELAPFPDKAVQTFFRIKDKFGRIVDFRYNRPQRLVAERGTNFNYVIKARKVGMSSRRIARSLWLCATRRYQHRILLTHTSDAAEKMIAERIIPMIDNCKFPLGAKPKLSDGFVYFPLTDSRYYIGTAGTKKFGRGDDVTGYDFSEFAHWDKPDVQTGVEEACVDGADGDIETTANGQNFAKIIWDASKLGKNRYRAIFIPWYAAEEYSIENPNLGIIGEEERKLIEAFSLSNGQIAWRRQKLAEMTEQALFPQEYPATDTEAFLTSGRLVFDWVSLLRHKNICTEPKWRGYLRDHGKRIEFEPNPYGYLKVWKVPEQGHVYAIGADIAEGLEHGAYSAAIVIDLGDGEQVAEWHGHIAPDLFATELYHLGEWYNFATVVPEAWPGPGGITTSHLEQLKYAKIWQGPDALRIGWETTSASKPLMIGELMSALRDLRLTIRSNDLLNELQGYVYDAKGHMVPGIGGFSDRLMALAIGWYATRDIANRVDYYAAKRPPETINPLSQRGTSVPRVQGPRPGVRVRD